MLGVNGYKMCILFYLWFLFLNYVLSVKLNVPRVLLPYNHDTPSNFTLKVDEGGCYKWSSSRSEVVIDEIEDDGCSRTAIVSVVTRSPSRQTAFILARDTVSSETLRFDVIIDTIHHLEIVTTTRELYVEEAPEVFEVRAYDDQGNEFSTLEGIEFTWTLQTVTERDNVVSAHNVVRFISFSDSLYETPAAIGRLEDKGKQGDQILIEGKQTGIAKVSVRLAHTAYKDLQPSSVNLMVIANLFLEPSDVYILAYTSVKYSVFHLKQGFLHPIDLESSHYYLQVANSEVGTLESDGITVYGQQIGNTVVTLLDDNVKSSERLKQPTAYLNVVEPSYLTITIIPHNNPSLIRDKNYAFSISVFDKNNNKIFLTENVVVETSIPEEYFNTEYRTVNGTYLYGVPIKSGKTKITAVLSSILVGDDILSLQPPISASQALEIFDPLSVIPPVTVLPWDPIFKPTYTVNLTALGGSGSVTWSSSDPDLTSVSQAGQCKTKGVGSVQILAAMITNLHNRDFAKIHVTEAISMSILDSIVEAEVNKPLSLPIALYTDINSDRVGFTLCHQLPIQVKPIEINFDSLEEALPTDTEGACASIQVVGNAPGFSEIEVSYNSTDHVLKASTIVAAYKPLKALNPSSGTTILAPGSSRVVLFEGGPLPWISKQSSHYAKITVEDDPEDIVTAELLKHNLKGKYKDIYAVMVHCNGIGEFTVSIQVGNKKSTSLPFPHSASSAVKVSCSVPDSLELMPKFFSMGLSCPVVAELGMAVAHSYKPVTLEMIVLDSQQRKFDNISSLILSWSISNNTLASIPSESSSSITTAEVHGFSVPLSSEQVINTFGEVGELTVTAQIKSYNNPYEIQLDNPLSATLPIKLVHDAAMEPEFATIFNHQENNLELTVTGGSGYFGVIVDRQDIILANYLQGQKKVLVSPVSDGNAVVTLIDSCLDFDIPVQTKIKVSSITTLDLIMVNKVEVGGSLEAEVIAKDSQGQIISSHSLMNLKPHVQSNIISMQLKGINSDGNAVYLITGKKIGDTTVKISATKGDSTIYSPNKPVQVFPPLTLSPRNITLLIGAMFQVESKGGPYPDVVIKYDIANVTVAKTSHSGIITALEIGTTKLVGRAVGEDGEVIYSEDMIFVNVVALEGVRIHAPLTHLETGTVMPLYIIGDDDNKTPVTYGTADPSILFEWSISNKQIGSLEKHFAESGISATKDNAGIVLFKSKRPGRVTVSLKCKVTVPMHHPNYQILKNKELVTKLEISVFESLRMKNLDAGPESLLMSPNSISKIISNRDGDGLLSYHIINPCPNELKGKAVISVDKEGIVKSEGTTGSATVLVTVTENHGITQSIAVFVEVKRVAYMNAIVTPFMSVLPGKIISAVPIGFSFNLDITYHDNRGRKFHATNSNLGFRPSRFDLVGVKHGQENNTLLVSTRDSGQTILHIWDNNYKNVDAYVHIISENVIQPNKISIPLGNHVCFTSPVRSNDNAEGTWQSDSPNMKINSITGEAVAAQIGKLELAYNIHASLITRTEVNVVPISKITVHPPSTPVTTVVGHNQYSLVSLKGEESISYHVCDSIDPPSIEMPFDCMISLSNPINQNIDVNDIMKVYSVFIPREGYACEFHVQESASKILSSIDSVIYLQVVTSNRGQQPEIRSNQIYVPFVPPFTIEKDEITLTNEVTESDIFVHGSDEMLYNLEVSMTNALTSDIYADGEGRKRIHIALRENIWLYSKPIEKTDIIIRSTLTGQIHNITVFFKKIGGGIFVLPQSNVGLFAFINYILASDYFMNIFISLLCICLTVFCLAFSYKSLYPGYKQTRLGSVFASSKEPAPVMTSSPSGQGGNRTIIADPIVKKLNYSAASPTSPRFSLWTQDTEPIYGAPTLRSSPRSALDGSLSYSHL